MNDKEEKQYAMTTVLVKFITDNQTALAASKEAAKEAADIAPAYATLATAVGTAPLSTQTTTKKAKTARTELLNVLPVVLGPLRSIATKTNNTALLARATLNSRQLRHMKPEELRDVSKVIMADADAQATTLADYALTAPVLAQLKGIQAAFAGTVRGTATLIDQRGQRGETASGLLRDLMQQVYELDKPMEVFRLLNKTLYGAYKKARRVGSTGSTPTPPTV